MKKIFCATMCSFLSTMPTSAFAWESIRCTSNNYYVAVSHVPGIGEVFGDMSIYISTDRDHSYFTDFLLEHATEGEFFYTDGRCMVSGFGIDCTRDVLNTPEMYVDYFKNSFESISRVLPRFDIVKTRTRTVLDEATSTYKWTIDLTDENGDMHTDSQVFLRNDCDFD